MTNGEEKSSERIGKLVESRKSIGELLLRGSGNMWRGGGGGGGMLWWMMRDARIN